jgi:hypothetical protein
MQGVGVVFLLTLFALAVIPLTIGYYLWLARTVLPRIAAALPPRSARMVLAMCIALPWFVVAVTVWWFRG